MEHISEKNVEELENEVEASHIKKIEASLFIAGRFLTLPELITLTEINPILIKKILGDLEDKYASSGLSIIKRDNSWKMDVDESFTYLVNKLATGTTEFTSAEQETLAMIAYKQPIKQSVVIKIRGNKAYEHVKSFVDIGLLNKKRIGHTAELTLTEKFYEYFHMNRGDPLPKSLE